MARKPISHGTHDPPGRRLEVVTRGREKAMELIARVLRRPLRDGDVVEVRHERASDPGMSAPDLYIDGQAVPKRVDGRIDTGIIDLALLDPRRVAGGEER